MYIRYFDLRSNLIDKGRTAVKAYYNTLTENKQNKKKLKLQWTDSLHDWAMTKVYKDKNVHKEYIVNSKLERGFCYETMFTDCQKP